MRKFLILDAGPLINLSMNGLLDIFENIKKIGINIVITNYVYQEVVDRPSHIPRFELGALRIKELIEKKIIQFATEFGLATQEIESETQYMLKRINCSVKAGEHCIEIVSPAEISCLAVSKILSKRGFENVIGIDERTTRVLFEKPANLKELMSNKLHCQISLNTQEIDNLGRFKFIRSSELVYMSYKKGFIQLNDKRALEALLYATKFKGCSITWEEIEQLKKL
ncbi:hypothetical protein EXS72_01070 [Candidatus Pacearchaeota archaeon]|nr:hypothetical protein [Candidatus Pacearchaeota archaeon]